MSDLSNAEMDELVGPEGWWVIGFREDDCHVVEWWTPALFMPSYTQGAHLTAEAAFSEALGRLRTLRERTSA